MSFSASLDAESGAPMIWMGVEVVEDDAGVFAQA